MNKPVYEISDDDDAATAAPPAYLPSSVSSMPAPQPPENEPYAASAAEAPVAPPAAHTPPVASPAASAPLMAPPPAPGTMVPNPASFVASQPSAPSGQPVVSAPPPVSEPVVYLVPEQVQAQPTQATTAQSPAAQPLIVTETSAFASRRDDTLNADPDLEAALQKVLMSGGSDLHVSVNAPPMIRVDGALAPIVGDPVWDADRVSRALYSILTPAQREKFDTELELDFAYTLSANARFRANFYQQRNNIGAAFRLIPTEIKNLHDLGVPETIANFAKLARGLVLVTGPTGSGKSTTLAGIIDLVNRTRADHIMTVEDPIEFLHSNHKSLVNQREVGHDTHSFAAALKHVLRQDPDVILVGELRDLETISVALTAAETGHLVFATLHTQSAPQTIDRIIDVYPPHQQGQVRAQLAATLQGVVCQTLVKRASGKGRVVATEVLVGTHAVANLIREGKTYQVPSAMQAGRDLGMHTMDQHLADLVNSGDVTFEAAAEKAQDLDVLKRLVTRSDTPTSFDSGMNFGDKFSDGQH